MNINYSQLRNTLIFVKGSKRPFTTIEDIFFDDQNGKVLAVFINFQDKIILPRDIIKWEDKKLVINSFEAIVEPQEIVMVDRMLKKDIWVLGNKVYVKSGEYLGKVFDYTFENKLFSLKSLHVGKSFLGLFRFQNRIISAEEIIEIKKDRIIVEKNLSLVRGLKKSRSTVG